MCPSRFGSGSDLFVIKTFGLPSMGAEHDVNGEGLTFLIVLLGTS